jgi:hypothetical protein
MVGQMARLRAFRERGERMRTKYTQHKDGDVIVVAECGKHKIECCDCGLVHLFEFAVVRHQRKNRVAFRAVRDNRATAQRRRARGSVK